MSKNEHLSLRLRAHAGGRAKSGHRFLPKVSRPREVGARDPGARRQERALLRRALRRGARVKPARLRPTFHPRSFAPFDRPALGARPSKRPEGFKPEPTTAR